MNHLSQNFTRILPDPLCYRIYIALLICNKKKLGKEEGWATSFYKHYENVHIFLYCSTVINDHRYLNSLKDINETPAFFEIIKAETNKINKENQIQECLELCNIKLVKICHLLISPLNGRCTSQKCHNGSISLGWGAIVDYTKWSLVTLRTWTRASIGDKFSRYPSFSPKCLEMMIITWT